MTAMAAADLPASLRVHPRLGDWVEVREDGGFTVYSGKVELGQGISAALVKVACEGLGADPGQVRLVAGDTLRCPDEGHTAGSQSIEVGAAALGHACGALRRLCAAAAAARLGVDPQALRVQHGRFAVGTDSPGLGYLELARAVGYADHRLDADLSPAPPVDAAVERFAPTAFARFDLLPKLTGGGFVHDLTRPGLLHARVLRGPHPASRLRTVDTAALRALDGVREVIRRNDFLALVGADEERIVVAASAAAASVAWTTPVLAPCDEAEQVLQAAPATTVTAYEQGATTSSAATRRLRRRYSRPYLAHAAIGPACAVAELAPGPGDGAAAQLTVWSHTQGPHALRAAIARVLGRALDDVRVVQTAGAGCYGHNGADDVAFDAALLSTLLGAPVRVQWTRADEMAQSPTGAAALIELDVGLDPDGRVADWQAEVWSPSHMARPGWGDGPNLLGAWACDPALAPASPVDLPLPVGGGLRNAVPGYALPAVQVRHHLVDGPLRTSALRSLGAHANVFAIESMMDELAALAGADPVAFRLRHLDDDRARGVVQAAARLAGWPQRPAGGDGHGLGFGFARYKNRAGYLAVAIEIEVDAAVRVRHVWAAADCGAIVHRDGLLNQLEGGILQALSWSLKEALQWNADGIVSTSWDRYPVLAFSEVPPVTIELIDRPEAPSLGAGELAPGPVAGALGNAVAHALGQRARHLPFTPERLLALVQAA